jgi:predicted transcriptional regulator
MGKSLPISMSAKLVNRVNCTRVISGRSTIQKVIKDLSQSETVEDTGVPRYKDARGYIVSGEFAVSVQRDLDLFTILTDLYDTHANSDGWTNSTKSGGAEHLKAPCVTLFSGASPEHFEDFIPKANIYGGFIGRTLLIYEDKRHKLNSLTDENAEEIDYDFLAAHLKMIKGTSGPFRWSPEGKKIFNEWFYEFRPKEHDDKTGTIERLPDHILKVAMCLSLAENDKLILHEENIQQALRVCLRLRHSVKTLTSGHGKSSAAAQTKTAIEIILKSDNQEITRQMLLVKGHGEFSAAELDGIIETLSQAGFLIQLSTQDGIKYRVTDRGKDLWMQIKDRS